jgi:F1F0 ATPase subunit 2
MSELLPLLISFLAGGALGAVYFTGLWATVRRVPEAKHPMLLLGLSLAARMSLLLAGLWLIGSDGHWERLVAAMVGIVLARFVVMRRLPPQETPR